MLAFGSRHFRGNIEQSRTLSELITASQSAAQVLLNFCQILLEAAEAEAARPAQHGTGAGQGLPAKNHIEGGGQGAARALQDWCAL